MYLNRELLEKNGACRGAISFCERNKLFGFPLSRLDEVEGDYNSFVRWLKTRTFDQNGNIIRQVDPDGSERTYEYDQNGNKTRQVDSDGNRWSWEYDQKGNLIRQVNFDSREWHWEYDQKENKIREVSPNGSELCWELEFYDNGQLKRLDGLKIPRF